MTTATSRWARPLLTLCFGVIVACAIAEISVDLLVGEQVKFPRRVVGAPWGLRYNEPEARYVHRSPDVEISFRINRQGMRADGDVAYAKRPGISRILCLGDSFTVGYEVEESDSFPRVLERRLRSAGIDVEVVNAGVSGFGTAEEYLYLTRELYKYEPDLVLLSFFGNDPDDNVRSGLFELSDGELRPLGVQYVPGGWIGDFANTNMFLNWLSANSDAFVLIKERSSAILRQLIVNRRLLALPANDANQPSTQASSTGPGEYARRLTVAILGRLHGWTTDHGIPLLINSIPFPSKVEGTLVDEFPIADFKPEHVGLTFFSAKKVLDPDWGRELLYWTRSHWHWTPLAHRLVGEGLAESILAHELLSNRPAGGAPLREYVGSIE